MSDPLLRVTDVTRTYRRGLPGRRTEVPALRGVSLEVHAGQRFGVVGESGSGKSTLMRIVAGLDRPTSGEVAVDGRVVGDLPERRLGFLRKAVQVVFQDPVGSLDPRMRVRDVIAEPLVAQGIGGRRERVAELLTAVGLREEDGERYPHQFSGGQRQRISIARALAPRPRLLVADEPVSALDVSVRAQVLNLLSDLVEQQGVALLLVSHDLSVVRRVCSTVAVVHDGLVVEHGPTQDVYTSPQHPYTRRLLASIPTVRRALAGVGAHELAAPDDRSTT